MASEKTLTNWILRELRRNGWFAWKVHGGPYQVAGMPDIQALKRGHPLCGDCVVVWWIEVKTPSGQVTKLQCVMAERLRKHGCIVDVIRSMDEFKSRIQHIEGRYSPDRRG